MLEWDSNKSHEYQGDRNAIIFKPCDKIQTNKTNIVVELINGKILTTIHEREVGIVD